MNIEAAHFFIFKKKGKRKIIHFISLLQHLILTNHKISQCLLTLLRNYLPPWYWYSSEITSSWVLKHMIGALGFYGYLRLQRLLSVK